MQATQSPFITWPHPLLAEPHPIYPLDHVLRKSITESFFSHARCAVFVQLLWRISSFVLLLWCPCTWGNPLLGEGEWDNSWTVKGCRFVKDPKLQHHKQQTLSLFSCKSTEIVICNFSFLYVFQKSFVLLMTILTPVKVWALKMI